MSSNSSAIVMFVLLSMSHQGGEGGSCTAHVLRNHNVKWFFSKVFVSEANLLCERSSKTLS